jgi:C_GCAxxG_C_C family probable redox protein
MSAHDLNDVAAQAQAVFDLGYNCAQAVLVPFAVDVGVSDAEAYRMASVFGAGMGRLQETCGALTGAFMALGLAHGFVDPKDSVTRDKLLVETQRLAAEFKQEFGSLSCRDLTACDLNTSAGQAYHKEQNQRLLICSRCVRSSAINLARVLAGN